MTDAAQTGQAGTQGVATPQDQTSAPQTSTQGAAQENAQATPQFVTMEQLSQVTEQIVSRLKQSDKDRTARINGELDAIKQRLNGTDVQLSPEQELKLRAKISDEIDTSANQPQDMGQASPPPVDQLIAQFVGDVFTEVGTQVTAADPEWKDLQTVIDATFNDPKGAIKVTRAAIDAATKKAQRLTANAGNPAAVIGSGGAQTNGMPSARNATELWSQAYKT